MKLPDKPVSNNGGGTKTKKPKGRVKDVNLKTSSLFELSQEENTVERMAIIGGENSGKTYSVLSLLHHLITVDKLSLEEIHIEFLDIDGGMHQLLSQITFPKEYLKCIQYTICGTFDELEVATKEAIKRLDAHLETHNNPKSGWIFVDNMEEAWELVRDSFCLSTYGCTLGERMQDSRASQIEAKAKGPDARGEAVLQQILDYGVINNIHNDWTRLFVTANHNFCWLSPYSIGEIKDRKTNEVIDTYTKFGAKANRLKVSTIILKTMDTNKKRYAEFLKSRTTKTLPKKITDTSWTGIQNNLHKLETIEKRERDAQIKKNFPQQPTKPITEQLKETNEEEEW